MRHTFEIYPESDCGLFFIEFSRWASGDQLTWRLFKRNYIYSEEEWQKAKESMGVWSILMSREGHPWNLGDGIVIENEEVIDMNTKSFLKFMVDSLNKNT